MAVSETISLRPYLQIQDEASVSFGGNQCWFPLKKGFFDHIRNRGGCGLVSACDFILYEKKPKEPVPKDEYMNYLRRMSRFRYPVFPRLGSFSFQQPMFVNYEFWKQGRPERLHFLFLNTKKRRLQVIEQSIRAGHPVILVIGTRILQPFSKKGVDFYRDNGQGLTLSSKDVIRHFVTITGIRYPLAIDEPLCLEIASWGNRYYIRYDELSRYISKYSSPLVSGIFYLK